MAKRKTSSKPTRIWKFAARPSSEDAVAIRDILFAARRYYNVLVAIERKRHERFSTIRRRHAPELVELEDAWLVADGKIEDAIRSTKSTRQDHWRETTGEKRRLMPPEVVAAIAALDSEKKRISTAAKSHRDAFKALLEPAQEAFKATTKERAGGGGPRVKSAANEAVLAEMLADPRWSEAWREIAASDDAAHSALILARSRCGLPFGTYLQVEEAFQRAKKDSLPRPPRFRSFDGTGKIAVQLRDKNFATLIAGTPAFSLSPAPHDPDKRGKQEGMLIVRMDQSVPRGEKRTINLVAKLHRMPPDDAEVKWAAVVVRRVGRQFSHELQLTLEHESFAEPKRPAGARSPEHVSIGWTKVDGGVRVATWAGESVVVPDTILRQHEHAATTRSAADSHYDAIIALMRRWMSGGPHRFTAWHRMRKERDRAIFRRTAMAYAAFVLGDQRVRAMWWEWKVERLPRGEDLYPSWMVHRRWLAGRGMTSQSERAAWILYTWARKDDHLTQYAANDLARFARRRDAFFRAAAIRIATEFSSVTVDDYKISTLKELPQLTMPGERPREIPQHNVHAAAPGRFREILLEVMGPRCTPCERSGGEKKGRPARREKKARIEGANDDDERVVDAAE